MELQNSSLVNLGDLVHVRLVALKNFARRRAMSLDAKFMILGDQ